MRTPLRKSLLHALATFAIAVCVASAVLLAALVLSVATAPAPPTLDTAAVREQKDKAAWQGRDRQDAVTPATSTESTQDGRSVVLRR